MTRYRVIWGREREGTHIREMLETAATTLDDWREICRDRTILRDWSHVVLWETRSGVYWVVDLDAFPAEHYGAEGVVLTPARKFASLDAAIAAMALL